MDTQNNVTVQRLDLSNYAQCQSAYECYQAGFAGEPWNEWKKCEDCGASYGISMSPQESCLACGGSLIEFWPLEEIAEDISDGLSYAQSYCGIAIVEDRVIGLALGYVLPLSVLSIKLEISIKSSEEVVAYQDEIVVRPEWQGHGIGRLLYQDWMAWVKENNIGQTMARTISDPPSVVYSWYQNINYQVIEKYPIPDTRVILALHLDER